VKLSHVCTWREAALIRALARYRQQTGLDPSQTQHMRELIRRTAVLDEHV
jgi:glutamate dehydrogenase